MIICIIWAESGIGNKNHWLLTSRFLISESKKSPNFKRSPNLHLFRMMLHLNHTEKQSVRTKKLQLLGAPPASSMREMALGPLLSSQKPPPHLLHWARVRELLLMEEIRRSPPAYQLVIAGFLPSTVDQTIVIFKSQGDLVPFFWKLCLHTAASAICLGISEMSQFHRLECLY